MGPQYLVVLKQINMAVKMKLNLVHFLALAMVALAVSEAKLTRDRRSVNFTPSWGKRSLPSRQLDGPIIQSLPLDEGSRCLSKGLYLEMLVETLKAELDSFGECLGGGQK